ncbi:MAG TPA: MerR family transcriptional regulator [Acidimicrobiales bacterium]|nr:MerR family transcriptional regulator [Acidimicrobiales bacterium]
MSGRSYLSIGDVLTLLRQEFPDVTISKIRFLESQGLVNPERTPSGYRKFYDHDVERLRWVLRQQREHFLPLKVIKGRLEHQEAPAAGAAVAPEAPVVAEEAARDRTPDTGHLAGSLDPARVRAVPALVGTTVADEVGAHGVALPGFEASGPGHGVTGADAPATRTSVSGAGAARPPRAARQGEDTGASASRASARAGVGTAAEGSARRVERGGATRPSAAAAARPSGPSSAPSATEARGATGSRRSSAGRGPGEDLGTGTPVVPLSGTSMTVEELAAAAGLTVEATAELESYGLLAGRTVGGVAYYDEDALTVARLAAGFAEFGVEARHLRLHKHAAEREAGFIEQIVLPLLRQRNPESRQRAQETTAELSRLGQAMRAVLLRAALRDVLGG